jgi:TolB protein
MPSKFINKSAQKVSISSSKANYVRSLIIVSSMVWINPIDAEDMGPIVVKLATEHPLIPIYLSKANSDNSFPEPYVNQLEDVFRFDLSHNGATRLLGCSTETESLSKQYPFESVDNGSAWKSLGVLYVVKWRIQDRSAVIKICSVNTQTVKITDSFPLKGDLSQDRTQIHRIANLIHKTLFGTEGIATSRFLYTVKQPINLGKDSDGKNNKSLAEVWEADYDGANARQITHEKALCVTPSYIPPKPGFRPGSFCYVSYRTGQPKIYVASLKNGEGQRVMLLKGNQLMPAVSYQRDKMAFICDVTGNPDLFLQSFTPEEGINGKPQQIFSTCLATQASPTFSPDGKQIAFVSNKDGLPRIYVMEIPAPGTRLPDIKAKLITRAARESTAPVWSPDGTKLAYCAMTQGSRQIWIYDFTTDEERQLTQGAGHKENPAWAPNSLHLIFNSVKANSSDLYLINLNQPEAVKITSGPGEKRFPSWEPK